VKQVVSNKTQALREWLDNMTAAQDAHPAHEAPLFTKDDVVRRYYFIGYSVIILFSMLFFNF
jgi:hypothetical protein